MRLWLILLLLVPGLGLQAQTLSWDDFVALVQDDEQSEEQAWAAHLEDLALLHAAPLDINTATRDDLRRLPRAVSIARRTLSIAKQNIVASLAVKFLILGLGIFVTIPMYVAIIGDVGVLLAATLNALRALRA